MKLYTKENYYLRATPKNMIKELDMLDKDYEQLAKYGHFA